MGLDMFAFTTASDIPAVDFEHPDDAKDIFYWRAHWRLHSFMADLYRSKNGGEEEFNCVFVRVDPEDLDILSGLVAAEPKYAKRPDDILFICKARQALAEGRRVYYASWW